MLCKTKCLSSKSTIYSQNYDKIYSSKTIIDGSWNQGVEVKFPSSTIKLNNSLEKYVLSIFLVCQKVSVLKGRILPSKETEITRNWKLRLLLLCFASLLVFPHGPDGKKICLQCRRPGFNPWVETIPWRREWLLSPEFFFFFFYVLSAYYLCFFFFNLQ